MFFFQLCQYICSGQNTMQHFYCIFFDGFENDFAIHNARPELVTIFQVQFFANLFG